MTKYVIASFFRSSLGSALKAVLLLIVAFIVAAICKALVVKLLDKTKLAKAKTAADPDGRQGEKAVELIGKLVQLVIFLLFVPGIFQCLGLTDVSAPIIKFLNTLWGYVPNLLAAGIILWLGFYIAKLVRELLVPVLNKLEVNKLQKIAGIEVEESGKLSNTLAYLAYVLILIPVIITALEVLNIKAISQPAIAMLALIFKYIPYILAALIIIVVGWIIARFIGNIVERLISASGLDAKLIEVLGLKENTKLTLSVIIGKAVQIVLVIFFVVESFSALHLGILTKIGTEIIAYMPYVLSAIVIFAVCWIAAAFAANALEKAGHATAAIICKYIIYVIAAFMILNELGIAKTLVDSAFILMIAAVAVAFAISFGVGGREFARKTLATLDEKLHINDKAETK